jgi:hypothetical protein
MIYEKEASAVKHNDIDNLIAAWQHHARRLMWDAPTDKSVITATQAMEHDAIIYIDCIRELREAMGFVIKTERLLPPELSEKKATTEQYKQCQN